MTRGSRRKRPRRFWRRWRRNQYFPNFPDTEHTNVLLVETSAPLRFPNSYSTSCELQGRRSVRYNLCVRSYSSLGILSLEVEISLSPYSPWIEAPCKSQLLKNFDLIIVDIKRVE